MLIIFDVDKPSEDPNIRGDAFKTIIVARLSYEVTEQDLEREFGRFGPIERVRFPSSLQGFRANITQIRLVTDTKQHEKPNKKKKKHRGYAFVVYEREKDMRGKDTATIPQYPRKIEQCRSISGNGPQAAISRPEVFPTEMPSSFPSVFSP